LAAAAAADPGRGWLTAVPVVAQGLRALQALLHAGLLQQLLPAVLQLPPLLQA
jgi:hypothetical protein